MVVYDIGATLRARRLLVYAVNKKTERREGRIMADRRPPTFRSFTCPNCQALYHVVKGEAGPETVDKNVACRACGAPFAGREEGFVLKYFLRNGGRRRRARRPKLIILGTPRHVIAGAARLSP